MARTLISLGANLGNVRETMRAAKRLLVDTFSSGSFRFSGLYRTPAIGGPEGQGEFLNAVVSIESAHSVWEIWEGIKRIETDLGRQRQHRWEARRIDIDVLLHDSQRVWTPHFKVPHPRMCMRSFILVPALEIASEWEDPVSGWTLRALAENLEAPGPMRVVVPDSKLLASLQRAVGQNAPGLGPQWEVWSTAEWAAQADDPANAIPKLSMVAVSTPDPETIQWEDYARPWAEILGMLSVSTRMPDRARHRGGPKYLLPANELQWAAHEIEAAHQAMLCPVEKAFEFEE